LIPLLFSK